MQSGQLHLQHHGKRSSSNPLIHQQLPELTEVLAVLSPLPGHYYPELTGCSPSSYGHQTWRTVRTGVPFQQQLYLMPGQPF